MAALLLGAVFWVLTALQPNTGDVPPAAPGDDPQPASVSAVESAPVVEPSGDDAESDRSSTFDNESPRSGGRPPAENQDARLSPETDFSQIIRGRTISLVESVHARHPVYIVAESVNLADDAALSASQIWIFADQVTGGHLDVSGIDGTTENPNGTAAGSIYVVANRINRVDITANGGIGAQGGMGARGHNGRDGSCAGFGGWRPAQRGGIGGAGQTGGRGGNAGSVRIVFGALYEPGNVTVSLGDGGAGGGGGAGGAGGDGCVGLGGAQPTAGSGSPGSPGAPGPKGDPETPAVEQKPELVADILRWLQRSRLRVEALQHVRTAEQDNMAP